LSTNPSRIVFKAGVAQPVTWIFVGIRVRSIFAGNFCSPFRNHFGCAKRLKPLWQRWGLLVADEVDLVGQRWLIGVVENCQNVRGPQRTWKGSAWQIFWMFRSCMSCGLCVAIFTDGQRGLRGGYRGCGGERDADFGGSGMVLTLS